ncbi:MAG TPA: amidohydrolase family protein [Puia sp.]|jgi:predicted TIM-barrel fold metal-dependent hydrolase|nr:amidohydrolase family protein [Puia sp.]
MRIPVTIIFFVLMIVYIPSCNQSHSANEETITNDTSLATFISQIKAVDNHAHANTTDSIDKGSDALPLDGLGNIELPARVRPESKTWVDAAKAIYGFTGTELNGNALKELIDTERNVMKQKAENFPAWALDQAGIEVMFANRITMGAGLSPSRFRWVSYDDALLFPLSTKAEASVTPDREKLFPLENDLLKKYLADLSISKLPATLDEYLKKIVTATLEAQKKGGCMAVKFEAAYLRSLDFEKTEMQSASEVYARYINGGEPTHEKYKLLQDFIFYYIAHEAGRLGMAVHIHSYPGAGNYFIAAGCDPLLLETVFNDPELRNTKFVLIHGGGTFSKHTSAMLWKPNVYADISLLTQLWPPDQLAIVLRDWLSQFPEKILFGTDAVSFGPGLGWEMSAWIASTTGRQALTIALSGMVKSNEITFSRAKEIATMVLRGNANNLYHLGLK